MKHMHIVNGSLFVVAYLVFVAYQLPDNAKQLKGLGHGQSTAAIGGFDVHITGAAHAVSTSSAEATFAQETTSEATEAEADEHPEISMLTQQVITSESDSKRRSAIARLSTQPLTTESSSALQTALTSDIVIANRIQVVNSLHRLSQINGDSDGKIRSILSAGMQDADPKVAAAVKGLYEKLSNVSQ